MKVCSICGLPSTCTAKIINSAWKFLYNQGYNEEVEKPNLNSIQFKKDASLFTLKIVKKGMKATEIWETPFGSHENTVSSNHGVLRLLNKWYKVLDKDKESNIITSMIGKKVIKSKLEIVDLCSQCKKESTSKKKRKSTPKAKAKKKVTVKEGETAIVVDE
ncbi:MAG: hypothetical protein ACXACU_13270, partial [Candidatus Hodarchaeales archaeon]